MTALQAAALYTALNLIILLVLAANVSRNRRRAKVSLGTGDDAALERAFRTHANATEYLPVTLIAIIILALLDTPVFTLHVIGVAATLGRGFHAYGMLPADAPLIARQLGTLLTWLSLLGSAVLLLLAALP